MRPTWPILVAIGMIGWLEPGRACAEPVPGEPVRQVGRAAGDGTAEPSSADGSDVVVRGRAPAPRSATESVRDQRVIASAPHRTASDVLAVLPGVWVSQHSGEGKAHQIFLRGFDAVHGQDVELWVGGAPVNEVSNIHGQGYADLHFVPPELVESVTLTPGSYDPRQGDFAVAGSVRYQLGLARPGFTAKASLGSYGARRLLLAWRPTAGSAHTFGAVESYATDGFGPARAAERHSGLAGYESALGQNTTLRLLLTASATRYDSAGVVRRSELESGRIDAYASYDPKQGGDSQRVQAVAELTRKSTDQSVTFAPYVVLRSLRLRANFTGFLHDARDGDNTEQHNDAVTVGGTTSLSRRMRLLTRSDRLELGLQLRHDRVGQSQLRLAAVDDRVTRNEVDATISATDVAGYVDLRSQPWRWLGLRGGTRIDGLFYSVQDRQPSGAGPARSTSASVLAPRATVDLRLAEPLHALLSYGEGFRSPQARSLLPGQRAPVTKVRSTELGLRYAEGPLSGNLAVFRSWLSDDLVFDQSTARNEAVPGTRRTGAVADVSVRAGEWLLLNSSVTYTQSVFRADAPFQALSSTAVKAGELLPYAPQLVARTDMAMERALFSFAGASLRGMIGSGLTALARRPLPFAEMGRDIFLWDARAQATWRAFTLGLDVMNLLDARYYDGEFVYASRFSQDTAQTLVPARHVTVGPPRTVLVSLTVQI